MLQPLYVRIQEELREKISAGILGPGDRIQSENALARRFSTTRSTVRQALTRLTYEGLIHKQAGIGTFVAIPRIEARLDTNLRQSFEEQIEYSGLKVTFQLIGFDCIPAPEVASKVMGLKANTNVFRLERLRLIDSEIVGYEERFILEEYGSDIPSKSLAMCSAIVLMDMTTAGPVDTIVVSVTAEVATSDIARKMGLADGAPILVRTHKFCDVTGRVILYGKAVYRGDANGFTYTLRNYRTNVFSATIP